MTHGYEQHGVNDIRQILREKFGVDDEEFLNSTKKVLVERLLELTADEVVEDLEGAEEEPDEILQPSAPEDAVPAYASELWHDYVMRQFREDELMDGAPTCDGCRRVIEDVLGPITSTSIRHSVAPTTANNGTATVCVQVELVITNETHPLYGRTVACEDVADVNRDNTDHPYHKYPSATAASRAEGRVLRKLLRLRNITTAEEVSKKAETTDENCEWEVDEPITDSQINVIDMMCQRLNIGVMDFVNCGRKAYTSIHHVNKSTGQRMIQELNKIQRKVKTKPEGLGAYVAHWRNNNAGN